MPVVHTIRLRGPWHYEPISRTVLKPDGTTEPEPGDVPAPGIMYLPADWGEVLGTDFYGRVSFKRIFHRPSGILAGTEVYLRVRCVDALGVVLLNGSHLGYVRLDQGGVRFSITQHLVAQNRLCIEAELPRCTSHSAPLERLGREGLAGGVIGEVLLEIDQGPNRLPG